MQVSVSLARHHVVTITPSPYRAARALKAMLFLRIGAETSKMNAHKFIVAGIIAGIYVVLAVGFVRADRQSHTGGFINLQGMMSALVTLPVAFPLEYFGRKINFRSNLEMGAAILACGALLFGVAFVTVIFADYVWNWTPARR